MHVALHTPLIDILGCDYPILLAGMGGVSRHELAAAVSNAGGFGSLGMVRESPALIKQEVEAYRSLSERSFSVNLIPAATDKALLKAQIDLCIELKIPAVTLFWDIFPDVINAFSEAGITVLHQVGSQRDADKALRAGVNILIAQGRGAGGHVRGEDSLFALLPDIVSMSNVPVVASGGITSGEGLVASLALGAQGVCCGTLFLATDESNAHQLHKTRIVEAKPGETLHTYRFFKNWPMAAAVRVLPNGVTRGDFDHLRNASENTIIAEQDGQPISLFSTDSPLKGASGDLNAMAIYAGESSASIKDITGAADRVERLIVEADKRLKKLHAVSEVLQESVQPYASSPCLAASGDSTMNLEALGYLSKNDLTEQLQQLLTNSRTQAKLIAESLHHVYEQSARQKMSALHKTEALVCQLLKKALHILQENMWQENTMSNRLNNKNSLEGKGETEVIALVKKTRQESLGVVRTLLSKCGHVNVTVLLEEVVSAYS